MRARVLSALFAALTLVVALAGCGSNRNESAGQPGQPRATAGFDGKTISLGVLSPLSGPVAVIGQPLTAGNQVWFDYINSERGGIAGKYQVKLVEQDTRYQPDVAVQQYNRTKGSVVAYAQVLGTPSTLAVLPQLKRDNVLAAPASLDGTWVRQPNLLPVGGPYQIEAINGLAYYVSQPQARGKPICSMIQDDAYGQAGQQGVDFAAKQEGFRIATTQRFTAGDKDVSGQISRLRSAGCAGVFLVALPADAATIWATAARLRYAPRWIAQASAWSPALGTSPLRDYLIKTVWIAGEATQWGDPRVPGMRDMIVRQRRYKPSQKPDYYFTFGYNWGRAMTAVLERAVARGDLSHNGVLKASQEIGTVSFDGLSGPYRYGPADQREPPRVTTVFRITPGRGFGLGTLKYNFESPAAAKFTFKG